MPLIDPFRLPPEIEELLVRSLKNVTDDKWILTLPFLSGNRELQWENR